MKKTYLALAFIFLFLITISSVCADFSISSGDSETTVCLGKTSVITDKISGSQGNYIVEISGTASAFTTTVPASFNLEKEQNIYSYASPLSRTAEGTYYLAVKVRSVGITKESVHKINVKECKSISLTADGDKKACSCERAKYKLALENFNAFDNNIKMSAEGSAKEWVIFSKNNFVLGSGKTDEVEAYVTPPCNVYGKYNIEFRATDNLQGARTTAVLEIAPCYEYEINIEKKESVYDNEEILIPVKIKNMGTSNNTFAININAPKWAVLDEKSIEISAGSEKTLNIRINPPAGTEGNYAIKVNAMSGIGNVQKTDEINFSVMKKYGVSLKFERNRDKLCKDKQKYKIIIKNTGKLNATCNLYVSGNGAFELSNKSITINAGDEKEEMLEVTRDEEIKKYILDVGAETETGEKSSDRIEIDNSNPEECYKTEISSEKNIIYAKIETPTIMNMMLENKGISESSYLLSLSGDGAEMATISPEETTLKPDEAETIYLYISPSLYASAGEYKVRVIAEENNSNTTAEKEITIVISDETAEDTNIVTGFFSRIKNFFKNLLTPAAIKEPAKISEYDAESEETNEKVGMIQDFIFQYKNYMLGAGIIILFIIIILSGIGKRIIDFFDEEPKKKGKK